MHKTAAAIALAATLFPAFSQAQDSGPNLLAAAAKCNVPATETALAAGGDPNKPGEQGSSALSIAATRAITLTAPSGSGDDPCLQTVGLLLSAGGDPALPGRAGDKSPLLHTALALATLHQRYAAFALLAAAEKDHLNDLVGEFGETPLVAAIRYRDPALVRILLQHGADPEKKDASGKTPKEIAAGKADKERMKMLAMVGIERTAKEDAAILDLLKDKR